MNLDEYDKIIYAKLKAAHIKSKPPISESVIYTEDDCTCRVERDDMNGIIYDVITQECVTHGHLIGEAEAALWGTDML